MAFARVRQLKDDLPLTGVPRGQDIF